MSDQVVEVNRTDAVFEVIEGEAIIINMSTGSYYSLDGSAGVIWEFLAKGPASAHSLARGLQSVYAGDAVRMESEIAALLTEMTQEGL